MKQIQKKLKDILEERLAKGVKIDEDFLGQAIKDKESQQFISEEFIIQLLFSISFASFESISTTLTLILNFLADHPDVVKELEVRLEKHTKRKLLFNETTETMRWMYDEKIKSNVFIKFYIYRLRTDNVVKVVFNKRF